MKLKRPNPKLIEEEILAVGSVDFLDIWAISRAVGQLVPNANGAEVRELCLDALERLAASGRIQAGDLYPPGEFSPWPFDADEAMKRIRTVWEELDRPVQPGDIAWFQVLEAGA